MISKRVTQKDIAKAAGVRQSTVSMALANNPSIPVETRERINEIARKIGYSPDPMLSALAMYRRGVSAPSYQGVLAWLVNSSTGYDWQDSVHYKDYYKGAKSQARVHGFDLKVVNFDPQQTSASRMASIMKARGISGILLCPQPTAHAQMDFCWDAFPVVTFGYTLSHPVIHTVTAAHYQAVRFVFDQLVQRGYKRIGLAIPESVDERCNRTYTSAFMGKGASLPRQRRCEPLYAISDDAPEAAVALEWIKKERIDAVITNSPRLFRALQSSGLSVPQEVGMACASLPNADSGLSGVVENSIHIGEIAVNFLVGMVLRGERGIPTYPQRLHVEGQWQEGETVRPLAHGGVGETMTSD